MSNAAPALNLYLVERPDCGYDEVDSFVIAAHDVPGARRIAAEDCGDEGEGQWLDERWSTVALIGTAVSDIKTERVMLRDFNAG